MTGDKMSFREIRIGANGGRGWLASFDGCLFAVFQEIESDDDDDDEGGVCVVAGLEHPYQCIGTIWPSVVEARQHFRSVCTSYAAGATPEEVIRGKPTHAELLARWTASGISCRTANILAEHGCKNLSDARRIGKLAFQRTSNCGPKTMSEIETLVGGWPGVG